MKQNKAWRLIEYLLLFAGLALLDYYIWEQASTGIYQSYESWTFDREVRGQPVSLPEFLRDELRILTERGAVNESGRAADENPSMAEEPPAPAPVRQRLADHELIGRLEIARVGVRAIVREGTDAGTLDRAVGHIPSTALPGEHGNVAIAAHRDTFFRGLAQIRLSDVITFNTLKGNYRYEVESTQIVSPKDVSVIGPTPDPALTMITCYPFHYVGSAPNRFIVRAKQIGPVAEAADTPPANARVSPAKHRNRAAYTAGYAAPST